MAEGVEFLREKYRELPKSPAVEIAAQGTRIRTGSALPLVTAEDARARIQNYLDRLTDITKTPSGEDVLDQRKGKTPGVEILRRDLYRRYIIKANEIPEVYYDSIKQRHYEEGHGDIEIPGDYRAELAQTIIKDQRNSLDRWLNYLLTDGAKYDDWLKYYAIRSVVHMGRYDKERKTFTERTGGTTSPFPELNREALVIVLDGRYPVN